MQLTEKIFDTLWKSNLERYPEIQQTDGGQIEFAIRFESTDVEFIFYFRMTDYDAQELAGEIRTTNIACLFVRLYEYWKEIAEQQTDWQFDLILNGDLYPGKTE